MGLGSFDFPFRPDADLVGLPAQYAHVLVYEGEDHIYTGVILRRSRAQRTIGGCGLEWWLGQDSDGPLIEDREYVSGRNKLSNFDFADGLLLWRVDEDPLWTVAAGVASISGTPTEAEILESNESFECEPGQQLRAEAEVRRTVAGTIGRARVRVVFEGKFRHENLVAGSAWTDESPTSGDADGSGPDLELGPPTRRQVVINAGFETGDLTAWIDDTPTSWVVEDAAALSPLPVPEGMYAVTLPNFGAGAARQLVHDTLYPVVPGERLLVAAYVSPWAEDFVTKADGFTVIAVMTEDSFGGNLINHQSVVLDSNSAPNPGWETVWFEFEVESGQSLIQPYIRATEVTVGKWAYDAFTVTHLERNYAILASDTFTVRHGRTYRLLASTWSDTGVQEGAIKAEVVFSSLDPRDDIIVDSPTISPTDGTEKLLSFDFSPPSGYHEAVVRFVVNDSQNGAWYVRESSISVRDTDDRTRWESVSSVYLGPGFSTLGRDVDVPDGAERFHLQIEVEADGDGWEVDSTDVHRRETPVTGEDIVAELLEHPATGDPLIPAGTIHPAGVIEYDWRIRNLNDREALKHLSRSGLAGAAREWRIRPDPELDWGTPDEIFEDRDGFVLVEGSLLLRGPKPSATDDYSQRLTEVKTIGADRTPVGGQKQIITGAATAPPDVDEVDWYGNPLHRTRIIEDSAIDTIDFAAERAELELERNSTPAAAARYELADWRVAGQFDVGDTIYAYDPDAGLVDYDNEQAHDGRTIWPAGKRVLSRTRKLGAGYKLFVRDSAGNLDELTDLVDWNAETVADVHLGNLLPEFAVDPQGGAAGQQFRRYRATTGR